MHALPVVVAVLLLAACTPAHVVVVRSVTGDHVFSVELAETASEQMRGLMFRDHLDEQAGMLFVFSDEAPRRFWMKNTRIPLDIIFITANGTIVNIRHAEPCMSDTCPLYSSAGNAQYVLEINGGRSSALGMAAGDSVLLPS